MENFKGTVNQFLKHCANLDILNVEEEIEKENAIKQICKMHDVDREEALEMLESAKLCMIQNAIDELMNEGLVEQSFREDGTAIYTCTKNGLKRAKKINPVNEKKAPKRKRKS